MERLLEVMMIQKKKKMLLLRGLCTCDVWSEGLWKNWEWEDGGQYVIRQWNNWRNQKICILKNNLNLYWIICLKRYGYIIVN